MNIFSYNLWLNVSIDAREQEDTTSVIQADCKLTNRKSWDLLRRRSYSDKNGTKNQANAMQCIKHQCENVTSKSYQIRTEINLLHRMSKIKATNQPVVVYSHANNRRSAQSISLCARILKSESSNPCAAITSANRCRLYDSDQNKNRSSCTAGMRRKWAQIAR